MKSPETFRLVSVLNRKKTDPAKFIFTGEKILDKPYIQLSKFNKQEFHESKGLSLETIPGFDNNGHNYWLNIYGLNETHIIAAICEKQGIHRLVIQDILDVNQRPKFQEYEKNSFLTLKSVFLSENKMNTEQVSIVFSENYLISFQERKTDFFEHLRYRLRENKGIIRERGVDYLLYTLLESILDNYFKTLNSVDEEIESFNFADTQRELSPDLLAKIEKHKKFVHFIKKSILPIKEFTHIVERGECQYIEQRHVKYFLEIEDLCLTLIDSCDMILGSLESATNLFFSVQGHRMNQVMKTLTIVATIFIPLTFIAGIYGMNFTNMPELEWRYGYLGIWLIIILILTGMLAYFKKKQWF